MAGRNFYFPEKETYHACTEYLSEDKNETSDSESQPTCTCNSCQMQGHTPVVEQMQQVNSCGTSYPVKYCSSHSVSLEASESSSCKTTASLFELDQFARFDHPLFDFSTQLAYQCFFFQKEGTGNSNCPPEASTTVQSTTTVAVDLKSAESKAVCEPKLKTMSPPAWREYQLKKLSRDLYCPGLLTDAADGKVNYNVSALNLMNETFGFVPKDPGPYVPFSLLEIFYERLKKERLHLKHVMGGSDSNGIKAIDDYFEQKPANETNRVLCLFLKAEAAYRAAHAPDPASFEIKVSKMQFNLPSNMSATVYLGTTSPI